MRVVENSAPRGYSMMYHVVDVVGPLLRIYYIAGIICAC
jgi:hypothetical protein